MGGARTALFNLLFARSQQGRMVLRIEDTDQRRSSRESEEGIVEDLSWLGLSWDEGPETGGPGAPYRQSERRDLYDAALQGLLDAGKAYEAWETTEELGLLREAAIADKGAFRYRGGPVDETTRAAYLAEGRAPVVRLKSVGLDVPLVDAILGEVTFPADDQDDFVLRKADGFPTYHLAVVVDDHHMEVSHVLRAQEHLMNTARHLALYEALGWTPPVHAHMPLIFSMNGGKMSKRDKAKAARAQVRALGLDAGTLAESTGRSAEEIQRFLKKKSDDQGLIVAVAEVTGAELPEIDVRDFREAGYLPEALLNFLALLGWSPGDDREIMDFEALVSAFTLARVGHTNARFDRDKLRWMNGQYIRQASPDRLLEALRGYLSSTSPLSGLDDTLLLKLIVLYQERATTLKELEEGVQVFCSPPQEWGPPKAIGKHLLKGGGLEALAMAMDCLSQLGEWQEDALEAALTELAEAEREGKMGKLAQPIRIALTGGPVSPPIFSTLVLMGREESLSRMEACLKHHQGMAPAE